MNSIKRIIVFTGLFLVCAAPSIYFDVMVPAAIDLPGHIKSLAVIDRSQSENKMVTLMEKGLYSALTGDKDPLSVTCTNGLFDQMRNNSNLELIRTPISEKRPGTSLEFPEPLQWFEVENYCKKFNADALIVLEIFNMQILKDQAEVKVGFRIYDPVDQRIIDQHLYFNAAGWSRPTNLEGVVMKLVNEDDAMYEASYGAGVIYAKRITPAWYRAERKYYKRSRGNDDLAEGARMMEVNDWPAAIAALEAAYENSTKRKTKGRAAHNLAVVHEILGDLDAAKDWAQTAWGRHRNKASRDYVGVINRRIRDIEIIRAQEAT